MKKVILLSVIGILMAVAPVAIGAPDSDVRISADRLFQADTLRVQVQTSDAIKGRLGATPLYFYKSEDGASQIALVGMPVNKLPGKYTLVILENNIPISRKIITVVRRKFLVTVLQVTPALRERGFTPQRIVENIASQENVSLKDILGNISAAPYSAKPFTDPLTEMKIVGNYGDIRKSGTFRIQHLGVDLKAAVGASVMAVNDGKVVFERNMPDYGNILVIDHGLGVYSLYLHLSEFKVTEGDMVQQGQAVALSGDTGYAIGPHLHFSIKVRGASVDPLKFIETTNAH